MSLFLQTLQEAEIEPASVYHQFLLRRNQKSYHCFFEGFDDPSFYMNFLQNYVNIDELQQYNCLGKKSVYETRDLVECYLAKIPKRTTKIIVMFFVDRDYSDLIDEDTYPAFSNVYVTDFYSIENHIICGSIFRRMLEEIYTFKGNHMFEYDQLQQKFESELERFYRKMTPITAWIIYMIRKGEKPNYSNYKISKVFSFDSGLSLEDCILPQYADHYEALASICKITVQENDAEIQCVIDELSTLDPKQFVRGKYVIEFFIAYLKAFKKFIENNFENTTVVMHPRIDNDGDAIGALGPRVPLPDSLKQFIETNIGIQTS